MGGLSCHQRGVRGCRVTHSRQSTEDSWLQKGQLNVVGTLCTTCHTHTRIITITQCICRWGVGCGCRPKPQEWQVAVMFCMEGLGGGGWVVSRTRVGGGALDLRLPMWSCCGCARRCPVCRHAGATGGQGEPRAELPMPATSPQHPSHASALWLIHAPWRPFGGDWPRGASLECCKCIHALAQAVCHDTVRKQAHEPAMGDMCTQAGDTQQRAGEP